MEVRREWSRQRNSTGTPMTHWVEHWGGPEDRWVYTRTEAALHEDEPGMPSGEGWVRNVQVGHNGYEVRVGVQTVAWRRKVDGLGVIQTKAKGRLKGDALAAEIRRAGYGQKARHEPGVISDIGAVSIADQYGKPDGETYVMWLFAHGHLVDRADLRWETERLLHLAGEGAKIPELSAFTAWLRHEWESEHLIAMERLRARQH